jgi:NAD(P)-dependent dehydrogenase (short-subunit alcohol dehydrogenase family)
MVSMKEVRLSNDAFKNGPAGLKALFVGATAGIGASAVKQFALHAKAPTVYLVGRSQTKAAPLLDELKSLNPQATFTFIEADVSLLKGVDKVCDEILAKEQKLDLLWLSQGLLSFAGQQSEFPSPEYLLLNVATNLGPQNRDSRRNSSPSCRSILLTDAVHL